MVGALLSLVLTQQTDLSQEPRQQLQAAGQLIIFGEKIRVFRLESLITITLIFSFSH